VEDTGPGLTAEAITRIFKPFEQAQEQHHRAVGTGLGLAISQDLAQMMDSQIQVESEPGQGSRFWLDLTLPIQPRKAEPQPQSAQKVTGYKGRRRKILVADDERYNRGFIVDLLTPLGFEVVEAANGREAVEQNKMAQPDFILMDLRMPEMSGLEAAGLMRQASGQDAANHHVVIVAASASAFDADREESKNVGCDGFLAKPIKPNELYDSLKIHLKLEWIFDESPGPSQKSALAEAFVVPPPEEMQILRDLAARGKLRRIRDRADTLKEQNPDYEPFADKLHELAQGFQERAILALIENWIQGEKRT
jgi:CheY-like chemotaxis protein